MSKQGYKTFAEGGIHPPYNKELSSEKPIKAAPIPAELIIPLQQNIGAPNRPLVAAGDRVAVGQKIGETDALVSAPVHSSVAGTVKAVEEITNFTGDSVKAVVITADREQPEFRGEKKDVGSMSADDIRAAVRGAGIVGMGGAAFPTVVKLSPSKDKPVDVVIINGCECEPFLTCDHRLMLESPADMVGGLELLMKAVGAEKGIIGIEANKMDAVEKVRAAIGSAPNLSIEILDVKYPEGSEKQLISAVTGRKVPPGRLPSEVGCLVQNVGTAIAVWEACSMGKPLYERAVTVTGDGIKQPGNYLVKIGTPISVLIDEAGGLTDAANKVIMGGPMTGWAQKEFTATVVKGTSGIVALTPEYVDVRDEEYCVRCGKCVEVCPMRLIPASIVQAVQQDDFPKAEMYGAVDCFECGCCSYTCPAYIPHVTYVRTAKGKIAALKAR